MVTVEDLLPGWASDWLEWMKDRLTPRGVARRAMVYRRLASYLEVAQVADAIASLERFARQRGRRSMARLYQQWLATLRAGDGFADAIAGWAAPQEAAVIAAAERAGRLRQGLLEAAFLAESVQKIRGTLFAKLSYPAILVLAAYGLLVYLSSSVVPTLVATLDTSKLTGIPAHGVKVAAFVREHKLGIPLAMVPVLLLVGWSLSRWTGELRDRFANRVPPWSIYQAYCSATVLLALATLTSAGVRMMDAVVQTASWARSRWLIDQLEQIQERLRAGLSTGEAFLVPLFDADTQEEIHVHAGSGDVSAALGALGRRAVDNALRRIARNSAILQALALVAVAFVGVGMIAVVFMTVLQATDSVGGL